MVLDNNATQCSTDADCERFGASCQVGVCVGQTFQFDNCKQLQLCDPAGVDAAWMKTVPPVSLGGAVTPITTQPTPTINCGDVSPNIVYVTGSTNLPPLLRAVQPLLDQGTPPYTVVFAPQTSCKGAAAIYDMSTSKHMIVNTPNNYAFYYDAKQVQTLCLLDGTTGNVVDVGESDVYPSSCGYNPAPGIADYSGPIQAITFVVPSSSKQTAISAEAAHLVFAAGSDNGRTAPWTDPHLYFVRSSGTGTVQIPSRATNVDPVMWWGIDRLSAANLVDSMKGIDPSLAERAIGVLSSDFADSNRANLRELAFQTRGKRFGYLADSTAESLDKLNVRNGHYPIWGAIHFLATTDSSGVPSAAARALINQFHVAKLDQSLVSAIIGAGFVPPCAMKVTHTTEVGELMPFQPEFGCSCFYEKTVNSPTTCRACTAPADCPSDTPACNYGFCETQ